MGLASRKYTLPEKHLWSQFNSPDPTESQVGEATLCAMCGRMLGGAYIPHTSQERKPQLQVQLSFPDYEPSKWGPDPEGPGPGYYGLRCYFCTEVISAHPEVAQWVWEVMKTHMAVFHGEDTNWYLRS